MSRTTSNMQLYFTSIPSDGLSILREFEKPLFSNIFYKNKEGLNLQAELILFDNDAWRHNPQLFCEDYYSNQFYWPIVLVCNDLGSMYEFIPDNLSAGILCPRSKDIGMVLSYMREPLDNEYLGVSEK